MEHHYILLTLYFIEECRRGLRGDNCSFPCGSCGGDGSCAKQNGECFYGCRSGWEGKECLNKSKNTNLNQTFILPINIVRHLPNFKLKNEFLRHKV